MSGHNESPGNNDEFRLVLQMSTFKDICRLYNRSYKVMRTHIAPIEHRVGKPSGRYYSIRQLEIIIKCLGCPRTLRNPPSDDTDD